MTEPAGWIVVVNWYQGSRGMRHKFVGTFATEAAAQEYASTLAPADFPSVTGTVEQLHRP